MITSYNRIHIFISSLHLSLWTAALVTFNEEEGSLLQLVFFACFIFFRRMLHTSCFTCRWSFTPHFTSTFFFESIPFFVSHLRVFRIESVWARSLAPSLTRQGRSFSFVRFASTLCFRLHFFVCFARHGRPLCKRKVAAGLDPSFLPKKCTQMSYILPQDHGFLEWFKIYNFNV